MPENKRARRTHTWFDVLRRASPLSLGCLLDVGVLHLDVAVVVAVAVEAASQLDTAFTACDALRGVGQVAVADHFLLVVLSTAVGIEPLERELPLGVGLDDVVLGRLGVLLEMVRVEHVLDVVEVIVLGALAVVVLVDMDARIEQVTVEATVHVLHDRAAVHAVAVAVLLDQLADSIVDLLVVTIVDVAVLVAPHVRRVDVITSVATRRVFVIEVTPVVRVVVVLAVVDAFTVAILAVVGFVTLHRQVSVDVVRRVDPVLVHSGLEVLAGLIWIWNDHGREILRDILLFDEAL